MMIANIIDGLPRKKDTDGPRTTLIVATKGLITQWFSELQKHVSAKRPLKILKYSKKEEPKTNDRVAHLQSFDVV